MTNMYTQNVFKSTFKSKILSSVRMLRVFKLLLLLTLLFFNGADVFAQTNRQVSGTIKDESKESLVGVSIKIKNTNIGTSTDIDGKFKIMASSTDVLQITYIGYETIERVVGTANQIDITMKSSSTGLGEVVVVGYSSKKLEQISSSVSVVSGEKLRDVTSNEVSSLLQGKAAGVLVSTASGSPTSGSTIVIRGAGSINASTSPLIVVDGNIGGTYNPTDIETITILKDAAATGLYGSRAANGVIIITTKTGKAGTTVMDFNTSVGLSNPNTGNFKLMNTAELYDYQSKFYSGLTPERKNNDTDWWDLAFRQGMVNSHQLSASGGSEKTQFYVSGNYYKEEGTLVVDSKTGYNFRSNLTQKLSDKLKLGVLLNGVFNQDAYNPTGTLYNAYVNLPFDAA